MSNENDAQIVADNLVKQFGRLRVRRDAAQPGGFSRMRALAGNGRIPVHLVGPVLLSAMPK